MRRLIYLCIIIVFLLSVIKIKAVNYEEEILIEFELIKSYNSTTLAIKKEDNVVIVPIYEDKFNYI